MKKFTITQEMLGRKEVVSILTMPIQENILMALKAEATETEKLEPQILHFLMDLGTVNSMFKNNTTDKVTAFIAEKTIMEVGQLPQKIQSLLGPQIYALKEITPRLKILSEVKRCIDLSLLK